MLHGELVQSLYMLQSLGSRWTRTVSVHVAVSWLSVNSSLGSRWTRTENVTVSWLSVNSYSLCTCYSLSALCKPCLPWTSVNRLSVNRVFAVLSCSLGDLVHCRVGDLVLFSLHLNLERTCIKQCLCILYGCQYRHHKRHQHRHHKRHQHRHHKRHQHRHHKRHQHRHHKRHQYRHHKISV